MTHAENAKQRFLRNHQENIRTVRAIERRHRREGNYTLADRLKRIIEAWEDMSREAEKEK